MMEMATTLVEKRFLTFEYGKLNPTLLYINALLIESQSTSGTKVSSILLVVGARR